MAKGVAAYQRRKRRVESAVVLQVSVNKGFSVFWATESLERARAIERLELNGVIARKKGGKFPWCRYRILTQK